MLNLKKQLQINSVIAKFLYHCSPLL